MRSDPDFAVEEAVTPGDGAGRFLLPALLWLALWASLNTGPWAFNKDPVGAVRWFHYLRAHLPLVVFFVAGVVLLRRRGGAPLPLPAKLWAWYGLVSLIASALSPRPFGAFYWAAAYLAVLAVAKLFVVSGDPVRRTQSLNHLSWLVATVMLLVLLFVAREALFVDGRLTASAYGVGSDVGKVAGVEMSRSSGMARFAAVPGIICLVHGLRSRGGKRLLWLLGVVPSLVLLYVMESRGAALAFLAAGAFALFFLGAAARWMTVLLLVVLGASAYGGLIPEHRSEAMVDRFRRGQTPEQLATLTGRTRAWKEATEEIKASPLLGRGQQADRYLIDEHVHNTYYYVLICSGVIGAAFFVGGLALAWWYLVQALRGAVFVRREEWTTLLLTGGILAFFTARSIPEVSGAMFGVDTILMVPVLTYIGALAQRTAQMEEEGVEAEGAEEEGAEEEGAEEEELRVRP